MKMKNIHVARNIIVRAVVLITALPLCGCHAWMFSVHRDIDVNSGVVRQRTSFLALPVGTKVSESLFSHEIRRLEIPTNEEHIWKVMTVSTGKRISTREYGGAVEDLDFLVQVLDAGKVPDQERRAILTTALSNLRMDKLEETYELIGEVVSQINSKYGLPPIPKESRKRVLPRGTQL